VASSDMGKAIRVLPRPGLFRCDFLALDALVPGDLPPGGVARASSRRRASRANTPATVAWPHRRRRAGHVDVFRLVAIQHDRVAGHADVDAHVELLALLVVTVRHLPTTT